MSQGDQISTGSSDSDSLDQNVSKCPENKFVSDATFLHGDSMPSIDNGLQKPDGEIECPTLTLVGHRPENQGENDLSPRQLEAIEWIINGYSDTRVAEAVGVDRRTIYRWRRDSRFMDELNRQRDQMLHETTDGLRAMMPAALELIARYMKTEPPDRAFRAATMLLKTGLSRGMPRNDLQRKEAA